LGEGADRLNISLDDDVTSAASLKNIETISLFTTADRTVNLEGATELETLNLFEGGNTVTVTKAGASVQNVNFLNKTLESNATLDSLTFSLKDSTGTEDKLNIDVKAVDNNENDAQMADKTTTTIGTISAKGIEEITITTSGLGKDDATTPDTIEGGLIVNTLTADKATDINS